MVSVKQFTHRSGERQNAIDLYCGAQFGNDAASKGVPEPEFEPD